MELDSGDRFPGESARGSASSIASRPRRDPGKYAKRSCNSSDRLTESGILAQRGVSCHDTAFQTRPARHLPDRASWIDCRDAVIHVNVVMDVLRHDMVVDLRCMMRASTIKANQVYDAEIFLVEREAVQGRGRWACQSNRPALRSQGSACVEEMLGSVVARVVDIGGRVHTPPEPHDQPCAARGGERTVSFTAIDSLSAAEESSVGPEQGPEVCIHGEQPWA